MASWRAHRPPHCWGHHDGGLIEWANGPAPQGHCCGTSDLRARRLGRVDRSGGRHLVGSRDASALGLRGVDCWAGGDQRSECDCPLDGLGTDSPPELALQRMRAAYDPRVCDPTPSGRQAIGMKLPRAIGARGRRHLGVAAGILALVTAAGCAATNSVPSRSPSANHNPSIMVRISAVNALYANLPDAFTATLIANPPSVSTSGKRAATEAIMACNWGAGTKAVATALVDTNQGPNPQWVVFLNPPGRHTELSTGPGKHHIVLNWYAAFVPLRGSKSVFCTFGRSRRLRPLPVFGSRE